MQYDNEMRLCFLAKSQNESFARVTAAVFVSQLDPTVSELSDIKTAVSEAVTNAIIHGYESEKGEVSLYCGYKGRTIYIEVSDKGRGIADIEQARQPLYTSKPELERSGMGFTVMEAFMDEISVESQEGGGTKITMVKALKNNLDE